MKYIAVVVTVTASIALGSIATLAQPYGGPPPRSRVDQLNGDVQRLWNDTFDAHRDGNRRTWERRREAKRGDWCRDHADYRACSRYR